MKTIDFESEVIRMGDVGVAIDMVEAEIFSGEYADAERAVIILKEIYEARYKSLWALLS